MGTPKEGGNPYNIDPKTLQVAPEQKRFGSGFKKPERHGIQGADKPIFEGAPITEAQRLANERWRTINKRMERYTQEQEAKIDLEYYERFLGRIKPQDIMPENFTPERQMEAAAIFEDIMEQMDRSLDDELETQRPDTPSEQDTSGDSSGGSSS